MCRILGIAMIAGASIAGALLAITDNFGVTKAVDSRDLIVDGIGTNITTVDVALNWWLILPLAVCFLIGLALLINSRKKPAL